MFNPLHSNTNQKMSNTDGVTHPNYSLKVKYPLRFFVSNVQPITQQYESITVQIQSSHYEKYGQFPLHKGSHHMLPPINTFAVNRDEWVTQGACTCYMVTSLPQKNKLQNIM